MSRKSHTKEQIITTLQELAKRLGKDTLTKTEVQSLISFSTISVRFGSLGDALEAAGLKRRTGHEHLDAIRRTLSDEELFRSLQAVEHKLGKEPSLNSYSANGDYSVSPFKKRFGGWPNALSHYRKWKKEHGSDVIAVAPTPAPQLFSPPDLKMSNGGILPPHLGNTSRPLQLYGEPIDFRGLRHAPINEQGVVYLFGMVSRELGFYIEAVQQGFPDCEGKYLYDKKKSHWAKARIEFEFKSSNFVTHGHDPNLCDFIVCWEHDWPDCPLHVIELKKEILKLSST